MTEVSEEKQAVLKARIQELESLLAFCKNEKLTLQNELKNLRKSATLMETTDPLTELFNRKTILHKLNEEMARAERFNNPLTLLLLDIDDFKKINDQYGDAYGDEVVRLLAKVLRKETRTFDLIGRYDGQEFLILFPETKLEDAYKVADRVRKKAEDTLFEFGTHVTISGGLKGYYTEDAIKLLREADITLRQAKEEGKNQILKSER